MTAYAGSLLSGTGSASSTLGQTLGSDGVVAVIGAIWNANGPMVVGAGGAGALTISEGTPPGFFGTEQGVVNAGTNSIEIGAQSGGAGSVDVQMGGTLEAGALLVGIGGSGTLDVSFEGQVDLTGAGDVSVGAGSGGNGTVEIDEGGLFDANGYFAVGGANASGALLVDSLGTLTTGGTTALGDIDASGSGTAAATVGGTWTVDGPVLVGNTGSGTLTVQAGGLVSATELIGGVQSTAAADIVVTGSASALTLTSALLVGDAAPAGLSILSGATVSALNAVLGLNVGGIGTVDLNGAGSVLDLANNLSIGAGGRGELTMGADTTLAVANNIVVGTDGVLQQSGGVLDPASLTNQGTVTAGGGAVDSIGTNLVNDGLWVATQGDDFLNVGTPGSGGRLQGGTIDGTGSLVIGNGGDLMVNAGTVFASQSVAFTNNGTSALLTIGTLAGFSAVIESFDPTAEIILAGTSIASELFSNGTLTVFDIGARELGTLTIGAGVDPSLLAVNADGGIGAVRCFMTGTRIRTDRGEVKVGGDPRRRQGARAAGRWPGRRRGGAGHLGRAARGGLRPPCDTAEGLAGARRRRRVRAGAAAPALFLSPDHAVYVGDVLIPIRCLINGTTIVQVAMGRVTYHHWSWREHEVLLAEGLPAESFLEVRDGWKYPGRAGAVPLFADFSARMWEAFGCARLVVAGPEVDAARALVARFAAVRHAA